MISLLRYPRFPITIKLIPKTIIITIDKNVNLSIGSLGIWKKGEIDCIQFGTSNMVPKYSRKNENPINNQTSLLAFGNIPIHRIANPIISHNTGRYTIPAIITCENFSGLDMTNLEVTYKPDIDNRTDKIPTTKEMLKYVNNNVFLDTAFAKINSIFPSDSSDKSLNKTISVGIQLTIANNPAKSERSSSAKE